jgi:phytoene dehydrogenase-like protein
MNDRYDPSEQKALESLVSAILHQFGSSEAISDKEIEEFLEEGYSLSEEQRNALAKLGDDPLAWITNELDDSRIPAAIREKTAELAGMHRHGSDEELDSETRKLIEQKRQQIIDRLRQKGKDVERPRD